MTSRPISDAQILRAVQAVKDELDRHGIKYHLANHHLSIGNAIDLHAMIRTIASALVSWPEQAPRQWALIERINRNCADEGWALFVCGDGMVVIEHDTDSNIERLDPFSYVEAKALTGSTMHQIALGLHGMVMTEET